MTTLIPAEFQPFVADAVASGKYRSEQELLAAALGLLKERERKLDALRNDLQIGIDELDRGDSILLDDTASQQEFFDAIKARGRQRLEATSSTNQERPGG
ncbi:MAG TPA: type II toxin-antitoxin system ParD family antitoxin [Pirellulales bacterium]|nr:type II toxin-antitoxin system ParD family antitoxin [Pirellulales bacterium]